MPEDSPIAQRPASEPSEPILAESSIVKPKVNDNGSDPMIQAYCDHYAERRKAGNDRFFSSFDGGKTADQYFKLAKVNWQLNLEPHLPHKKRLAFDIGFGGGGMLLAASESFERISGVDVHGQERFVERELRRRGAKYLQLFKGDGYTLPIEDASADFVFSWVTFLHLTMGEVVDYLCGTARILIPGGKAVIFYSPAKHGWIQTEETRVNIWRVKISDALMRHLAERNNLVVLDIVRSKRPNESLGFQHGIVMRKDG